MVSFWENQCQPKVESPKLAVVKSGVSNFPSAADSFETTSPEVSPERIARSHSAPSSRSTLLPLDAPREMEALSLSTRDVTGSGAQPMAVESGSRKFASRP